MTSAIQSSANAQKPIHILHVTSGDLWAGAEVMLYTLSNALHKEPDARVSVVILNRGRLEQQLRNCGIPVYVLNEADLNSFQILHKLNKIIEHLKPNVIHTHRNKENIIGGIAAWYNHIPSLRTVHGAQEHHSPFYKIPKRLILFLDWILGRFFQQHIIAVSYDLADTLECHFPKSKIKVIENGVDIDALTKCIPHQPPENVSKKDFKIGIACRLTPVKRVDLFISCALQLKRQCPETSVHFHIFGDGPLRDVLQSQVLSQQADEYIHFEGHCENIPQLLQTLDFLLITSDHEGLPMVLLEAMCVHTPIISHAVGGIPCLLNNGTCGMLVDRHTPESFAEAIILLMNQPEKCQQLTQQAFERVNKYYSSRQTATKYLSVYEQMIEQQP